LRVIVAWNIGFCFGVRRALDLADSLAQSGKKVYALGELIHNASAIAELAEKGVVTIGDVSEAPQGATVLIRSHGVPPAVLSECRARGLDVVDATCPFVERIHGIVRTDYEAGRRIAIFGEPGHPECVGINGCCENTAIFLKDAKDIERLDADVPYCIVAQTTASAQEYDRICSAAASHMHDVHAVDTLCTATRARQKEAEGISREASIMFVIGDRCSSNTAKLAQVCQKGCYHVYSLAKVDELPLEKIHADDIIGIVSGASAPDAIIQEVITRMSELDKTMAESPVENEEVKAEAAATVEEPVVTEPAEVPAAEETECACTCSASEEPSVEEPKAEETDEQHAAKAEGAESFAEAFEKTLVRIRNGQVLTGSVVQINDGEVCVNIGYKSDGFIPRNEFSSDPDVKPDDVVKIGDKIDVEVIKVNDGEGNVLLSRKNVESKEIWDSLMQDDQITDKVFEGTGKEVVKGGLIAVIDGIRAFVPASQLSTKYVENIGDYVGKPISLKVIEVDKARKRIVASHKAVMLVEAEEARKHKWEELEVGSRVKGVVRRLTDFGAFVDIGGGIDGLVHVTDVAWGRVKHPKDVLSVGQEIEVIIRDVDVEKQRVSLGYKQLQPKPWTMADEKYPVGTIVEGKVVRIVPFGAFVALEPTIDGLIHISQVGVKRIAKVEDEINVGDIVRCKVLDVNIEAKRISLSRREALLDEHPEIVEELAAEKAERERIAAERAEQRAAADAAKQQQQQERAERRSTERPERGNDRPERRERTRREENDYELPPVQSVSTSMADLLAAAISSSEKADEKNQ
jgi:4-hydroxy-3-methylbut-2-enyl diphosphate reductase